MDYQRLHQFDSLAAFNAGPHGWDVDIRQLNGTDKGATLGVSRGENILISTTTLGAATLQRGSSPPGMRSFALLTGQSHDHAFRGHTIDRSTLIIVPRDRELHAVSAAGVQILNISIDEHLLSRAARQLEIPDSQLDQLPVAVSFGGADRGLLLRRIAILGEFTTKYGDHRLHTATSRELEEEMVSCLLESLVDISRQGQRVSANSRYRSTSAALDYILDRPREAISIASLAQEVGASRRTLEKGFRELLDMSPTQFIRTSRLRSCRQDLLRSASRSPGFISETANNWGFWHMGQFAADYRREFGELPSQTVRSL